MTTTTLDLARWQQAGFLRLDGFLHGPTLAALQTWVDDIESWPAGEGPWLQHDELTDAGPRRTRSENFVPFHDGMRQLLTEGPLVAMASALFGEPAVLYKEKINYKPAGGAGFAPHQDQSAYPHITQSITCLLAVDDATVENGCLEFVAAMHQGMLPRNAEGCIASEVAARLDWVAMPVPAGSVLWFHGFTPHRSGPNHTGTARRALYLTYNRLAEGDRRATYYADKARAFTAMGSTTGTGAERLSLIGHFQGRPVPVVKRHA